VNGIFWAWEIVESSIQSGPEDARRDLCGGVQSSAGKEKLVVESRRMGGIKYRAFRGGRK